MHELMTPEYLLSFISTCEARGVTKEAAADLLQRESVRLYNAQLSGTDADYYAKTQNLLPTSSDALFSKSAGKKRDAAKAMFSKFKRAPKNKPGSRESSPSRIARVLQSARPAGVGVAGVGVGASALYGALKERPRNNDIYAGAEGALNADAIDHSSMDRLVNTVSQGDARLAELNNIIDSNSPQSIMAIHERKKLLAETASARRSLENWKKEIEAGKQQGSSDLKNAITQREEATALLKKPPMWRKALSYVGGKDPSDYYTERLLRAQREAIKAQQAINVRNAQAARLNWRPAGPAGPAAPASTPAAAPSRPSNDPQRFFHTYR